MKKIFFSLACMISFVLAFTSCTSDETTPIYDSILTGIYTSETTIDTSTVILNPNGYRDIILIQYQNGEFIDSIQVTPMVTLDETTNTGSFSDPETGWQGDFTFSDYGKYAKLTLTNQKTGRQLPIFNLTKSQFGSSLAGDWGGTTYLSNVSCNMHIDLYRPGVPDRGKITIDGTSYDVMVYGPDTKYGTGYVYIYNYGIYANQWLQLKYQLSALDSNYSQSIEIYYNVTGIKFATMSRLVTQ